MQGKIKHRSARHCQRTRPPRPEVQPGRWAHLKEVMTPARALSLAILLFDDQIARSEPAPLQASLDHPTMELISARDQLRQLVIAGMEQQG